MNLTTYLELLKNQRDKMTIVQKEAISEQQRLSAIALEKQKNKDDLEERYLKLLSIGCKKLFEMFPDSHKLIPDNDSFVGIAQDVFSLYESDSADVKDFLAKTKLIPELRKCSQMNYQVGKAYYEFLMANDELNRRIASDRATLFSKEYRAKMSSLADDGVFLYYLETPDLPLLNQECNAEYILESFSFADYISARTLFSTFAKYDNPGEPLKRKIEDAHAALEMMYNKAYRSAARNWFAMIEHEHKRCADILEGYWEAKRTFKNGQLRSEKISQVVDNLLSEWDIEAWKKIDAYYKKLSEHPKENSKTLNRNIIIHGDYENESIDVSEHDAMRLFLMWINLRVITDNCAFIEEFLRNQMTLLPYFCSSEN